MQVASKQLEETEQRLKEAEERVKIARIERLLLEKKARMEGIDV